MKNFFFKILLLFLVFPLSSIDGQITTAVENVPAPQLSKDSNKLFFLVKESFPFDASGEIFLDREWKEGTITDLDNNQFTAPLRYRIAQEEMQIQHNNKTKALQIRQIKKVELGNRVFIPSEFILNDEKFFSFFKVVNNGDLQLLLQYEAKEKRGNYTLQKTYFTKYENGAAKKFSSKKKCVFDLMKNRKGKIQNYIKTNKVNLKDSNDIVKLFEFYNSLK